MTYDRCELQGNYINPEQLHTVSPSRRRHIASTWDQSLAGGHTFDCNVHTVSHIVNIVSCVSLSLEQTNRSEVQ